MENMTIAIISVFIIGVVLISFASSRKARRKLISLLISSYGAIPAEKEYDLGSIGMYSYYKGADAPDGLRVDDITWSDLDLDKVFRRINVCLTSVGEEYLYNCLHEPRFESDCFLEREKAIAFFTEHNEKRLAVQIDLTKLGKTDYNGLASLIFDTDTKMLKYPYIINVLSLLPLFCALILIFNVSTGVACIFLSFIINLIVYSITKKKVNIEIPAISYFASMLYR